MKRYKTFANAGYEVRATVAANTPAESLAAPAERPQTP